MIVMRAFLKGLFEKPYHLIDSLGRLYVLTQSKKVWGFLLLVMLSMLSAGCDSEYDGWHTLSIEHVGTLRLPHDCMVTQDEYAIYITDKAMNEEGYTLYMIGSLDQNTSPLEYLEGNIEFVASHTSAVLTNHVIIALYELKVDDQTEYRYSFSTPLKDNGDLQIYYWAEALDKKTAEKIAKSFDCW